MQSKITQSKSKKESIVADKLLSVFLNNVSVYKYPQNTQVKASHF